MEMAVNKTEHSLSSCDYVVVTETLDAWPVEMQRVAVDGLCEGLKGDDLLYYVADHLDDASFDRFLKDIDELDPKILAAIRKR